MLIDALSSVVGAAHVRADAASCALAVSDLFPFPSPVAAEAVVSPGTSEECAAVVRAAVAAGHAVVARGAGLSYTRGSAPAERAVVVDTGRLARVEVHAEDRFAIVGAGCTWQGLAEALAPHRLRVAVVAPISGAVTTVGGALSQGVPGGLDEVLGLTVALADGTLVRTGSSARVGASAFARNYGPDLTGLFLGDCGVFGVKTEAVLRLIPDRPAAFASFAYDDAQALLADLVDLQRQGLVTRALAMDQAKASDASGVEAGEAAKVLGAVLSQSGSLARAARDVVGLARGRQAMRSAVWSLHLTVEGASEAIAKAQLDLARAICGKHAKEIDGAVPKALRARPYSIRGFVGVEGERWVPVHGVLPLARAIDCFAALDALFAGQADAMRAAQVRHSYLISTVGAFVTIEPMFLWPDALDALHELHLSARNRERFMGGAANPQARELVARLRTAAREVLDAHDAIHAQLGRFYRYADVLEPGTHSLVERLKLALDPQSRMNPGALGLP